MVPPAFTPCTAGCTGSQLAAAAAAAAAAGGGGCGGAAGSSDSSATALAHLEAVLDHARSKGRHVLLVNNCPEMQWEPTTRELGHGGGGGCDNLHGIVRVG